MGPSDLDVAPHRPAERRHRASRRVASVMLAALFVLAVGATIALAAHSRRPAPKPVVDSAHNTTLSAKVAVDSKGRTLYALSGETAHHLKCTTAQCLRFWPPLTVASARAVLKDGPGVDGRLGTLKRPGGIVQVTLRGLPLYRFLGDQSAGSANGQLIASFGGVWHAVGAASGVVTTAPSKTLTTTSSSSISSTSASGVGPTYPSNPTVSNTGIAPGASTTTAAVTSVTSTMATSTASACTTTYAAYPGYTYPC